jgi:hypothetical protein
MFFDIDSVPLSSMSRAVSAPQAWRGSGSQRAPMRDHVRGSGLVALPSADQEMHILGTSHVDEAHLTGAVLRNDGTVVYPAESPRPG